MTITNPATRDFRLPEGWSARAPGEGDVSSLARLLSDEKRALTGSGEADEQAAAREIIGIRSWGRRQVVLIDIAGELRCWASVHDRSVGRCDVMVAVDRSLDDRIQATIAAAVLHWIDDVGALLADSRFTPAVQLDAGRRADDAALGGWLEAAGYLRARTWLEMGREVRPDELGPEPIAPKRAGVEVRPVAVHSNGLPVATEVQAVHQILEESFADHFNSYRETFQEFVLRTRPEGGRAWDDWWLAHVEIDGRTFLGGALVASELPATSSRGAGTYIDYIGVHRLARDRGVAKALLGTVVADAAARGRDHVDLEVDAESPTGANGLYAALGWETSYRSESWHREVDARERDAMRELEVEPLG